MKEINLWKPQFDPGYRSFGFVRPADHIMLDRGRFWAIQMVSWIFRSITNPEKKHLVAKVAAGLRAG